MYSFAVIGSKDTSQTPEYSLFYLPTSCVAVVIKEQHNKINGLSTCYRWVFSYKLLLSSCSTVLRSTKYGDHIEYFWYVQQK